MVVYLPRNASKARLREAENARKNRAEIVKAFCDGQVSRRDLIRMGLMSAAGTLVMTNGLSVFAPSAYASIPTGAPSSPLFGVQPFTQPMPRFDVLPRNAVSTLSPAPTAQANTTQQPLNPALEGVAAGDTGPIEGRPPGPIWAHQQFAAFPPRVAIEVTQQGAKVNNAYNPQVPSSLHSGLPAPGVFPGQFYEFRDAIGIARYRPIDAQPTGPRAAGPDDRGGIVRVAAAWSETMSTHRFHDHMFSLPAQNVYEGIAGMFNIY